jgi:hypothetical protein
MPGEETSLLERSVSHDDEEEKKNVKTPSTYIKKLFEAPVCQ